MVGFLVLWYPDLQSAGFQRKKQLEQLVAKIKFVVAIAIAIGEWIIGKRTKIVESSPRPSRHTHIQRRLRMTERVGFQAGFAR